MTDTPVNSRDLAIGLGAFAAGAVAWVIGTGRYGDRLATLLPRPAAPAASAGSAGEHIPIDLLADHAPGPHDRTPDAFRPDPTAVPTAEERESLRPATGPAPTLVADRGSGFAEGAGAA